MPRFNPYSLPRPEARVETREFSDPSQPDVVLALSMLVCREAPFKLRIQAKIDEYTAEYIHGKPSAKQGKSGTPIKYDPPTEAFTMSPNPNGAAIKQKVLLDESTVKLIAVLETMQVPEDGDAPYDFNEFVQIAVTLPDLFIEAGLWAFGLLSGMSEDDEDVTEADEPENP